jgi:two-component system, chemotaxis family, chemotaxis protein CheY
MNKQQTKILIIDDHDAVRLLLGLTLKDKYNVITKRDGIDGMAWLAAGNIPDLIILDMQMPRLNGLDFLKQLRSSGMFKLIPVLLVSANDNENEITESFDLGILGFISKPFNPVKLKEKIHLALQKPSFMSMS